MTIDELLSLDLTEQRPLRIAPTDLAAYLRMEQCERFYRLQLLRKNGAGTMFEAYGVQPTALPGLLTRAGSEFEMRVLEELQGALRVHDFAAERAGNGNDMPALLDEARQLVPGARVVLAQARIEATLGDWLARGDIDLLLLERDGDGALRATVLDMKSSPTSKVEHRLQVAFYLRMLEAIFGRAGIALEAIAVGIVFKGVSDRERLAPEDLAREDAQRAAAQALLGLETVCLDLVADPTPLLDTLDNMALGPMSAAAKAIAKPFAATDFSLEAHCDGCAFNEICAKWTAERDDLSLIPLIGLNAKRALRGAGVTTTAELAHLKEPGTVAVGGVVRQTLVARPETAAVCRTLAGQRVVGARLDELVLRARRHRRALGEAFREGNTLPATGPSSLPYSAPDHDPNLVRVFIDVQRDYLTDRVYLASAAIIANVDGAPDETRRRTIVELADAPPDTRGEERLMLRFIAGVISGVLEVAAPDPDGEPKAPIHLIFWDAGSQRTLLTALGRHQETIVGATALYDFITQQPAFESPLISILLDEIRQRKNYPTITPSLVAISRLLGFDWDREAPLSETFATRVFDDIRPRAALAPEGEEAEDATGFYTGRARFSSVIPLEYVYAAWDALPPPRDEADEGRFRQTTLADLRALAAARLAAIEHVAGDFQGNDRAYKSAFDLAALADFSGRTPSLAVAIDEFVVTERHVALAAWKADRVAPPEDRMLAGVSLVVRYREADQDPGIAALNRDHCQRAEERERIYAERTPLLDPDDPEAKVVLSDEEKAATRWDHAGMEYRFEITAEGSGVGIETLLGSTPYRAGSRVALAERWSVDTRQPEAERARFQTTVRQLLYGDRGDIVAIEVERDAAGKPARALVRLRMAFNYSGEPGFVFRGRARTFVEDELYTLEDDPNDIMLSRSRKITEQLEAGQATALVELVEGRTEGRIWPAAAAEGQARFLAGLDALRGFEGLQRFEPEKRRLIGALGDVPAVLVQGPPGTGKSFTTSYAIWARMQGALAAGIGGRVLISCMTHAATDVLLAKVAETQETLRRAAHRHPELFARYFDPRLLDVPLYRVAPKTDLPHGVVELADGTSETGKKVKIANRMLGFQHAIVAATPGGIWRLVSDRWSGKELVNRFIDLAVLDEASQMSLPLGVMATMPLELGGQLLVVGDHRQMPPIVQHDWAREARRLFREYAAFESLYVALDKRLPAEHHVRFARSFRLHRDMAEFLRREIYAQDGIPFHAENLAVLEPMTHDDPFVAAALGPEPLTIVVHDEAASQTSNPVEEGIVAALVARLAGADGHRLDARHGVGVVVPHRAQRAALIERAPELTERDPVTGEPLRIAVDTVERFQGDERRVIVVSLTESDPAYLRQTSAFLLDPRRLNVALSRAKEKLVVVASRSIFTMSPADEETFAHAAMWRNFLLRTCTEARWRGEIDGVAVEVRVNPPLERPVGIGDEQG